MKFSWINLLIILFIVTIFVVIFSLISYYFSKKLVKWLKNIQRIDNRKDLDNSPKLKEIVRIIKEVSRIYRIKTPEIGIYPSEELNAFATGPTSDTLIAFSSKLINVMTIKEIRGVIGHELSHLIHYDLRRILFIQGSFDILYWTFSYIFSWIIFSPKNNEDESEKGSEEIVSWFLRLLVFKTITNFIRFIGLLIVLWYNRKRELAADLRGAKIVGIDNMMASLKKLLELENKSWVVDGIDLTEDKNFQQGEPNSLSLLKFNPEKKKRGFLDLLRTHPTLEERIKKLENFKKKRNITGII